MDGNPVFTDESPEDLPRWDKDLLARGSFWRDFLENRPPVRYGKGEMIYLQGESAARFYYLQQGRAEVFLSSPDGAEKILTVLEPGRIFGEAAFFDRLPRVSSARAAAPSLVASVGREELLERFRKSPQAAMDMLQYLSRTVRMLSAQVDHMTFLSADRRIARLLLQQADREGRISCTHEELGGLAGVSRVTVSKLLSRFAAQGWLVTSYRYIRLIDRPSLRAFAYG
ncbi:MAG: Crp/Fnr family transcriptional regulator [Clostridiales bacterium]|nr:Crp/Fnr family transcriptional regulator [Clostridiales bacterium]